MTPPELERSGRFRLFVAFAIAAVSIIGAAVAWRASVAANLASDLDQQATQELVLEQQERATLEGIVANDLRLFARYQEHILAWRELTKHSERVRPQNPDLADLLETQANGELSLARALRRFFQGGLPDFGNREGVVVYDRSFVLRNLVEANEFLPVLRPEETAAEAETAHDRTVNLVGVFTLFAAALFFLTVAQFARTAIRGLFAGAGALAALGGLVLFAIVEIGAL